MFILSIKPTFRLHLHQDEKRDRKKSERSDGGSQVKSHESHIGIFKYIYFIFIILPQARYIINY